MYKLRCRWYTSPSTRSLPPQLCYQGRGSARYRVTFILIYGNFLPSRAITVSEHCRAEDARHAAGIAEQKSLEHRVEYATVDLNLSEEYKAQLGTPAPSISTRFHNALVKG